MSLIKADPNKQGWEAAVSAHVWNYASNVELWLTFGTGIPYSMRDMPGRESICANGKLLLLQSKWTEPIIKLKTVHAY